MDAIADGIIGSTAVTITDGDIGVAAAETVNS
jgi:hypothetical protein